MAKAKPTVDELYKDMTNRLVQNIRKRMPEFADCIQFVVKDFEFKPRTPGGPYERFYPEITVTVDQCKNTINVTKTARILFICRNLELSNFCISVSVSVGSGWQKIEDTFEETMPISFDPDIKPMPAVDVIAYHVCLRLLRSDEVDSLVAVQQRRVVVDGISIACEEGIHKLEYKTEGEELRLVDFLRVNLGDIYVSYDRMKPCKSYWYVNSEKVLTLAVHHDRDIVFFRLYWFDCNEPYEQIKRKNSQIPSFSLYALRGGQAVFKFIYTSLPCHMRNSGGLFSAVRNVVDNRWNGSLLPRPYIKISTIDRIASAFIESSNLLIDTRGIQLNIYSVHDAMVKAFTGFWYSDSGLDVQAFTSKQTGNTVIMSGFRENKVRLYFWMCAANTPETYWVFYLKCDPVGTLETLNDIQLLNTDKCSGLVSTMLCRNDTVAGDLPYSLKDALAKIQSTATSKNLRSNMEETLARIEFSIDAGHFNI
jgi:hypothetical protein